MNKHIYFTFHTASLTKWNSDLAHLPGIELADVLIYLNDTCEWGRQRLKGYRQQDGYLLSHDKHISGDISTRSMHAITHFNISLLTMDNFFQIIVSNSS